MWVKRVSPITCDLFVGPNKASIYLSPAVGVEVQLARGEGKACKGTSSSEELYSWGFDVNETRGNLQSVGLVLLST